MEELDLKELLSLFWSKKTQIILIISIFMLIGVIYTVGFVTPKYTSSTTLLLATSENSTTKSSTITTTDITLNSKLVSTYTLLIQSKSVLSQVISNLQMDISEEELKNSITVTQEKVQEIYKINNVQVVDKAELETEPSNINHSKDILIFTFVGLVVAVGYVLIANMLDTTIKSAEEVEKQFKIPVLASIPLYNFEPVKNKGGKKR